MTCSWGEMTPHRRTTELLNSLSTDCKQCEFERHPYRIKEEPHGNGYMFVMDQAMPTSYGFHDREIVGQVNSNGGMAQGVLQVFIRTAVKLGQ